MSLGKRYVLIAPGPARPWYLIASPEGRIVTIETAHGIKISRFISFHAAWIAACALAEAEARS